MDFLSEIPKILKIYLRFLKEILWVDVLEILHLLDNSFFPSSCHASALTVVRKRTTFFFLPYVIHFTIPSKVNLNHF